MKKLITLSVLIGISTSIAIAGASYTSALKDAIKQDIETSKQEAKNYNASVKEAIKKDIEAKAEQRAKTKEINSKKDEKIKELNSKILDLNKQKLSIQLNNSMSQTEKTLRLNSIEKQIEFYNNQKEVLKNALK